MAEKKKAGRRKKKIGRPPDQALHARKDEICGLLKAGWSLRKICLQEGMPAFQTVLEWAGKDAAFAEQYAGAREIGLRLGEEEMIEIADNAEEDAKNPVAVQRDKLRIDTRKWVWAKQNPKRYGDRVALAGDEDAPLRILSDVEAARQVGSLLGGAAARMAEAENGNGANGHD